MENNIKISLANKESCTGCGACMAVCPRGAIRFEEDFEGFPSPVIDAEKCIQCGLCEKNCPEFKTPVINEIIGAYAAQSLDRKTLAVSSSGGLFTVFAEEIISNNGVVYGCKWDESYHAVICRAETFEESVPMRGSKYVWSRAADVYPQVKNDLIMGRAVLYSGVPCQIAGLKNYLGKEYDNLYLLDSFCAGMPSPFAFREYLKTLCADVPDEKLNLKFRDKEKYGHGVHITYLKSNGSRAEESADSNPYYFAFKSKITIRRSCYHCHYRYSQRVSDLTMGDFWDVGRYHPQMDIRAGVSALLVNSEKGENLLSAVRDKLTLVPTTVANIAGWNNLTLSDKKVTFQYPPFRTAFFETLHKKGWEACERKYLRDRSRMIKLVWGKTPAPVKKALKIVKSKLK